MIAVAGGGGQDGEKQVKQPNPRTTAGQPTQGELQGSEGKTRGQGPEKNEAGSKWNRQLIPIRTSNMVK